MPSADSSRALNRASLSDLAKFFLRPGTTAFGGPAAHIAIMEMKSSLTVHVVAEIAAVHELCKNASFSTDRS